MQGKERWLMLDNLFASIITEGTFTGTEFLITTGVSLLCGFLIAALYMVKNKTSKSYAITLTLLPVIVELVIMLVNGNIGAGVAVAGAFSLVRFRSAPGTGQEITSIFLAMAVGLATGMGYIGIAMFFTVIVSVINLILNMSTFGGKEHEVRVLKITVPENLDFEGKFDDILDKYLVQHEITEVKTANMGSLYKISMDVTVRENASVKEMMDELRKRNGNLEISLARPVTVVNEL